MSKKKYQKEVSDKSSFADNITESMPKDQCETQSDSDVAGEERESADNLSEENVEDQFAKLSDSYVRLMAEYDNYRKRTLKEKADLIRNGGEKILSGLLPVIDDFQRALETIDKSNDVEAVKEGVDLIYNKFVTFLQQNGVKPIDAVGKEFDDELGEAVAVVPAQSEEQKGKIIDSVQTGYTLNDKVLRHAKVVVAN
jgi:Molecular chaperone GrpE (heat shock protein)